MKKRIFNLILVSFLILSVLFVLTACGDDDGKDKDKNVDNSTPEETIESFIDAVNDHDTGTMFELIDFDALESTFGEYYNKKEFKDGVKEFFEDNEDFEISSSKITSLEDDDELMESLLGVYDSYDEYIEEIEDEYDLDNVLIYVAKLKVPKEYKEIFDNFAIVEGKDIIYMTEDDGEYKIIYSRFSLALYADFIGDDYDYDYDDDDYDYDYDDDDYDYDDESGIDEDVVDDLKEYEGLQTGKDVKELADYVVDNTTADFTLYIDYYGEDGIIDEYMINSESEIKEFKKKLKDSHKYKVEIEPSSYGYCYIDITY